MMDEDFFILLVTAMIMFFLVSVYGVVLFIFGQQIAKWILSF